MFDNNVYIVYLDGSFAGICEDELECWEVAQDVNNGVGKPLTDDDFPDRVWYDTININRYYKDGKNVCDKISNDSFLCASDIDAIDGVKKCNELNLERERLEAKLRAMAL
jgi:hypothetical protein